MSTIASLTPIVSELAVAAAWNRYLNDTQAATPQVYDVVEQEAWRTLERRLRLIGRPLQAS